MSPTQRDEIESLSRVFEKAPYPVFICDRRSELVFANAAATQLYSTLHKAPSIDQWPTLAQLRLPGSDKPLPTNQYPIARALRGEVISGLLVDVHNIPTRSKYRMSIDAHPVYGADGELIGAVSVHRLVNEKSQDGGARED